MCESYRFKNYDLEEKLRCSQSRRYEFKEDAQDLCDYVNKHYLQDKRVYRCSVCGKYHIE